MVSRLIISLKKAVSDPRLDMETPSAFTLGMQDEYSFHMADGIPLSLRKAERV